jgi:hypothetical protein
LDSPWFFCELIDGGFCPADKESVLLEFLIKKDKSNFIAKNLVPQEI